MVHGSNTPTMPTTPMMISDFFRKWPDSSVCLIRLGFKGPLGYLGSCLSWMDWDAQKVQLIKMATAIV